jgi:hypothetical protein
MEDLGRRVERWVAAGVIGRDQGEAILALEGTAAGAAEAAGGRRAVVVEVLGYLGGGLALVAGFVLGAESWAELGYWGRAAVLGAVTVVLLVAGWRLRTEEGRVLPRLASVLWLGAVAGFAGLLAVLLGGRSGDAVDDPTLAVAGGALVLAAALYLLERRVLQQVALFGAAVATLLTAGGEFLVAWDGLEGVVLAVLGAAWLELGTARAGGAAADLGGAGRAGRGVGVRGPGHGGAGVRGVRGGRLGAVGRAGRGRGPARGRERLAPQRAAGDRDRGHGRVPGPGGRPVLGGPGRAPGHPAGRAGPGRGRGGPGPAPPGPLTAGATPDVNGAPPGRRRPVLAGQVTGAGSVSPGPRSGR